MRKLILHIGMMLGMILTAGCVGPLYVQDSARTVGDNKHALNFGYGNVGYVVKWTYGLTEDLDMSLQTEPMAFIGIKFKYAIINQPTGFSLAPALGYGLSWGGEHVYGDLIMSYKGQVVEPYIAYRYTNVTIDEQEYYDEGGDGDDVVLKTEESSYQYGLVTVGSRFWFNKRWSLTAEASFIQDEKNEGLDFDDTTIFGASCGINF